MTRVIGADLGSQSVKAVVTDDDARELGAGGAPCALRRFDGVEGALA